jgi:hypothetical protein
VTPAPPEAPSAPQQLAADPVLTAAGPALELEWDAPAKPGSGVRGYRVSVVGGNGKPVGTPLAVPATTDHVAVPTLPAGGVYTLSVSAWSARGTQQATGTAASIAVATLLPGHLAGENADGTVTATWDWDATADAIIKPSQFAVRVVNADGTTAGTGTAEAADRTATVKLTDASPGKLTVEVWAVFTTASGLDGVSEPVASPVQAATPPSSPTPTPSPSPSASSSPSASPTPSSTPTPSTR